MEYWSDAIHDTRQYAVGVGNIRLVTRDYAVGKLAANRVIPDIRGYSRVNKVRGKIPGRGGGAALLRRFITVEISAVPAKPG
jgi:hypothetical protein